MSIPFVDLQAQYRVLQEQIGERIQRVLAHGNYIMGPEIGELERTLGDYVGVKHAVSCASGTDALLLPLMALGVGPGDAVFTTPFTFIATAEVISLLGATPVFVDIDPVTYNIDPASLARAVGALTERKPERYPLPRNWRDLKPKGVMAVDLYGLPADYDAVQSLCTDNGLFLIEDGAQSFGGEYKGRRACSFGDAAGTSFFPAKPLGCYGDGGMAFTNRDDLAEIMRSIRIHGKGKDKYDNVRVGLNARMDTLQAAVVLAKFGVFRQEVEKRQEVAAQYGSRLCSTNGIGVPIVPDGYRSGWAQYTLRVPAGSRSAIEAELKKRGIPTAVYYPKPLHLQGAYASLGYAEGALPEAERASHEVISVPFGPYIQPEHLAAVVEAFNAIAP